MADKARSDPLWPHAEAKEASLWVARDKHAEPRVEFPKTFWGAKYQGHMSWVMNICSRGNEKLSQFGDPIGASKVNIGLFRHPH